MLSHLKKFKRAMCKLVDHDYDRHTWVCKRCKRRCTYEEYPDHDAVPHVIMMRHLRKKYLDLLPPIQRVVKEQEDEEERNS